VLDAAELHTPYFNDAPNQHRLLEMFEDTNIYKTLLADALKGESRGKYAGLMRGLFPSTTDIATFSLFQQNQTIYNQLSEAAELGQGNEGKQMDKFYELLLRHQGVFKNKVFDYHKYFCVVHADGDNLGKLGNTLTDAASYQVLSKKLATYAIEAANIINEHGGKPVYIGGDDLLFFAPVCSVIDGKTKSVLHLIQHLREAYDNLATGTTISFGITLTYYKFPLFAARQLSYEQLFYHAKKAVSKDEITKNAIAFRLIRHSGAWFEGLLSNDMLIQFINTETAIRSLNKDMMSGIVQKMDTLSPLMDSVAQRDSSDDRFKYLLENFFNEPIHRNNKNEMELVGKLMHETYKTGYISGKEMGNKNLYAILRLLKFVSDQSTPEQGRQLAPQANNQPQQNN
jgi:CRISPR-associated protein Cmr2